MAQYAEFEIALRRHEAGGYPVEMRFTAANSDSEERVPASGTAHADIDAGVLQGLKTDDYGRVLGKALFAEEMIRQGLANARASVRSIQEGALRVRLFIDAAAEEGLYRLHWELLCDPDGNALFNGNKILFSRYLASSNWQPVRGKTDLKALVVVANPPSLTNAFDPEDYDPLGPDSQPKLAPVDVPKERKRAEDGFRGAGIAWNTLATGEADSLGPATADNILDHLDTGYDILYLVCHGGLMKNGVATLHLEGGEVIASKLVERIRDSRIQPRLIILASCESAGGEAATAAGTLSALGPKLVDAGIPAVVAMQGKVKMSTLAVFMPVFLAELAKESGQIDQAMGVARERAASAGCRDYWMPALFLRIKSGCLWNRMESVPLLARPSTGAPSSSPRFASTVLAALEQSLVQWLGPIAGSVVRKESLRTASLSELCGALASQIPDEMNRSVFLRACRKEFGPEAVKGTGTSVPSGAAPALAGGIEFDLAFLALAKKQLVGYIGPLAKVKVEEAAKHATSLEEFTILLSAEIDSPSDRQKFVASLRGCSQVHGPGKS